jgi:hypothetical protein
MDQNRVECGRIQQAALLVLDVPRMRSEIRPFPRSIVDESELGMKTRYLHLESQAFNQTENK